MIIPIILLTLDFFEVCLKLFIQNRVRFYKNSKRPLSKVVPFKNSLNHLKTITILALIFFVTNFFIEHLIHIVYHSKRLRYMIFKR